MGYQYCISGMNKLISSNRIKETVSAIQNSTGFFKCTRSIESNQWKLKRWVPAILSKEHWLHVYCFYTLINVKFIWGFRHLKRMLKFYCEPEIPILLLCGWLWNGIVRRTAVWIEPWPFYPYCFVSTIICLQGLVPTDAQVVSEPSAYRNSIPWVKSQIVFNNNST